MVGLGVNREPWIVDTYNNRGFRENELSLPSKLAGGLFVFTGNGDIGKSRESTFEKVATQHLLPALGHIADERIKQDIIQRFKDDKLTVEIVELLMHQIMGSALWCRYTSGEFSEEHIQQAISYLNESGDNITEYNIISLLSSPLGKLEGEA